MKETIIRKPIVDLVNKYLQKKGIDTSTLKSEYPMTPAEAEGLDPSMPLQQYFKFLEQAAKITNNEDIGLHFYHGADWTHLGPFGYAIINSATVGEALRAIARYHCLMQNNSQFTLEEQKGGDLVYSYRLLDFSLPVCRYDNDANSGRIYVVRDLSGRPDWTPKEVHFSHSAPENMTAYKELLGCPIVFDAPLCKIFIDAEIAACPVVGSDSRLATILELYLNPLTITVGGEGSVIHNVQRSIASTLSNGVPSIDEIARQMYLSRRSLQRRLKENGQTFQGVLETTRKELALQYLESTSYALIDVAFLLGYSELSPFIRAFRRWTGVTPQRYRQKCLPT